MVLYLGPRPAPHPSGYSACPLVFTNIRPGARTVSRDLISSQICCISVCLIHTLDSPHPMAERSAGKHLGVTHEPLEVREDISGWVSPCLNEHASRLDLWGENQLRGTRSLQAGTDPNRLVASAFLLLSLPFAGNRIHFCFPPPNKI